MVTGKQTDISEGTSVYLLSLFEFYKVGEMFPAEMTYDIRFSDLSGTFYKEDRCIFRLEVSDDL